MVPGTAEVVIGYTGLPDGGTRWGLHRKFGERVDRRGRLVDPLRMVVDYGVGPESYSMVRLELEGSDRYALIVEDDRSAREVPFGDVADYSQRFIRMRRDGTLLQDTELDRSDWWNRWGTVWWNDGWFVGVWGNPPRMGALECSPGP